MPKIQLTILLTLQQIADLLCCALEGGSNYWYLITDSQKPERFDFMSDAEHAKVMERAPQVYKHLDYPLNPSGSLTFTTLEGDEINGKTVWTLDLEAVSRGAQAMSDKFPDHFADALSESNMDAGTGDVFLQCCLFGDVVYG